MSTQDDVLAASQNAVSCAMSGDGENPPVSFVTNTSNDSLAIPNIPDIGVDAVDIIYDLDRVNSDEIANSVGFSIKDGNSLAAAIASATNYLTAHSLTSGKIATAVDLANHAVEASNKQAKSSLLIKSIANTINTAVKNNTISNEDYTRSSINYSAARDKNGFIIEGDYDYSEPAYSALPFPKQEQVITRKVPVIKQEMKQSLELEWKSYDTAKDLRKVVGEDNYKRMILELEPGDYPTRTTPEGVSITKLFGNVNNDNLLSSFYSLISTICPDIKNTEYVNYRTDKDLYDLLLRVCATISLTDLLIQLLQCPEAMMYFDDRSKRVLRNEAVRASERGDIYTYHTIAKFFNYAEMRDAHQSLVTLDANMMGDKEKITLFGELVDGTFSSPDDIVYADVQCDVGNYYHKDVILDTPSITFPKGGRKLHTAAFTMTFSGYKLRYDTESPSKKTYEIAQPEITYPSEDDVVARNFTMMFSAAQVDSLFDEKLDENIEDYTIGTPAILTPLEGTSVDAEFTMTWSAVSVTYHGKEERSNVKVINGNDAVLMSTKNTIFIDSVLSTPLRKLVQAAMAAYN